MKYLVYVVLILFFSATILLFLNKLKNDKELNNIKKKLEDTLLRWKDKEGLYHTKISALEGSSVDNFLTIKSKDSIIIALQKLTKKYEKHLTSGGNVTVIHSTTKIDTVFQEHEKIKVIINNQEIPANRYTFNLKNYVEGYAITFPDSLDFHIKIKNKYSVIIGEESKGWFKPKEMFVEVINDNPYTEIQAQRAFVISKPKGKRFGIGVTAGYGISIEKRPQLIPFIGIGINYNIIQF